MPRSVALYPYSIRVKRLHSREEEEIDSFGENGTDLRDFLKDALLTLKENGLTDENDKTMMTADSLSFSGRTLRGVVETGEFGLEGFIRKAAGGKIAYTKKVDEANMQRFYFRALIPQKRTKGIIVVQRSGVAGMGSIFFKTLKTIFEKIHPEYRLHIHNLSSTAAFSQFLKGNLRKIRFIRFKVPKAVEDAYGVGHLEKRASAELVVKLRGLTGMPFAAKVLAFLEHKTQLHEIIELTDEKFEPDLIKFEMELNGKRRVLNVANPDLGVEYDITKMIKSGADGHPTLASMDEIAAEYIDDLGKAMYGKDGA